MVDDNKKLVENLLKEFKAVKARRSLWERTWELVSRYVLTRKQGFTEDNDQPEFYLHGDVYDDVAPLALNQMVSSLTGALWKGARRTVRIVKPKVVEETEEVKEYYDEVNRRFEIQMDHPDAGFVTSFQEYMTENGAFGTSGLGTFPAKPGSAHLVDFRAVGLKYLWVQEDAQGNVIKIFYEVKMNAFQIIEEYGQEAMTDDVKAAMEVNDYNKKFKVLWVLRPREKYNPSKKDNKNMAFQSLHILEKEMKIVRDTGFTDLPIKVTRFYKNEGEEYGRSPAMVALPSIVEINALWEMITKAGEKKLSPPLWLLDDGSFGGGVIDTSPDALNVLDSSSRITSGAPIGVIADVGDPSWALKLVENLSNQVIKHFFVDRLLDLNNQTRMTFGEAQIRNELRADSLGGVYNRQIDEQLTPTCKRVIGILVAAGEFGVEKGSEEEKALQAAGKNILYIPDEVLEADAAGEEIYNIEYVSPALRILRSEELRGITSAWQFAAGFATFAPEFLLMLDKEKSMKLVAELSGATDEIFLSKEKYEEDLAAFRETQANNAKMAMEQNAADVAAKRGSAAQQHAQAQATMVGASGGGGGQIPL
jgi:hypothetical protein